MTAADLFFWIKRTFSSRSFVFVFFQRVNGNIFLPHFSHKYSRFPKLVSRFYCQEKVVEYSAFVMRASSDTEYSCQGWYIHFLGEGSIWLMVFERHFAGLLIMNQFCREKVYFWKWRCQGWMNLLRNRVSLRENGEICWSADTEWDGLNPMRPQLCSVWFLPCAGINSFRGNVCQKVFLSTDRSAEHSSLWQIAESVWSSGLKTGLETPELSFWLHPQLSSMTLSKSFELLWARFIAPVILFDRPNEEVYGPIYLNFPICKRGWVLLVCNYYPRVLKCFKSLQHFDVSSPICWYVGYLHSKKF